jgi:four helix bundle protein
MPIHGLRVLSAARAVGDDINRLLRTTKQPADYAAQLRDAAESIAANIVEGFGRGEGPDRDRFLRYSRASAEETDERLRSGFADGRVPAQTYWRNHHRLTVIVRMLNGLMTQPARADETVASPKFPKRPKRTESPKRPSKRRPPKRSNPR